MASDETMCTAASNCQIEVAAELPRELELNITIASLTVVNLHEAIIASNYYDWYIIQFHGIHHWEGL